MGKKKDKCKEEFLSNVMGVDTKEILARVRGIRQEDIYTHFVTSGAINSGVLGREELSEFFLSVYSDWYFLHKNTFNISPRAVKLLREYAYTPVKISEKNNIYELITSGEYSDVLPISLQYINKLEDKFFVTVRTEQLHNVFYPSCDYNVRLYLNIKCDSLLEFAQVFLSRAYSNEFPAILKILNGDYRNDTITIYTDYEYVSKVIDTLDDIKFENRHLFEGMGVPPELLGKVNDYIGFGEVEKKESAYLHHRCMGLSATVRLAEVEYLRRALMRNEEKVIKRANGKTYTPTEYLEYLIKKNATAIIENRLNQLEDTFPRPKDEIKKLRAMLDNIWEYVDINEEVSKLKRSFTRNERYVLELNGVGKCEFDYISKLYALFGGNKERGLKPTPLTSKKDFVSSQFFKTTDSFEGLDTREFLEVYFRTKLSYILQDVISKEVSTLNNTKTSSTLTRLKRQMTHGLNRALNWIVDEDDEGRVYLDRYIYDLLRILSTNGIEMVETSIAGKPVPMDTSVTEELVELLPFLKDDIKLLSENSGFVDNILLGFGINSDNLCLSSSTKNICKGRCASQDKESRYYRSGSENIKFAV